MVLLGASIKRGPVTYDELPTGCMCFADEAAQEAVGKAISIFLDQDMVKRLMGLKGSVLIRSCSYSLLSIICKRL